MFDSNPRRLATAGALAVGLCFGVSAAAQQTPQQGQPGGAAGQQARPAGAAQGAGGGRAGFFPDTMLVNDTTGFVRMVDGTLRNWDGDPAFWRVENNVIIGESTAENVVKQNTFLIYRGDERLRDFELKAEIRMNSTNSGIQIRSKPFAGDHRWRLAGHQADFDFTNQYTGSIYDEQGRQFLAVRSQFGHATPGGVRRPIGKVGEDTYLKGVVTINGWNRMHIIARGNLITYMINGVITSQVLDDDPENRELEGLVGLQLHTGPPMKVEFRNVMVKKL